MKKIKKMKMSDKIAMEAEHTHSKKEQRKIVQDHEKEHGPAYYPALKELTEHIRRLRIELKNEDDMICEEFLSDHHFYGDRVTAVMEAEHTPSKKER